MIRGFYTALAGLVAAMTRQAVVADNIANVNTPGFKESAHRPVRLRAGAVTIAVGRPARAGSGPARTPTGLTLDQAQGPLETTGIPTDLGDRRRRPVRRPDGDRHRLHAGGRLRDRRRGQPHHAGRASRVLGTDGQPIVVPGGASAFAVGTRRRRRRDRAADRRGGLAGRAASSAAVGRSCYAAGRCPSPAWRRGRARSARARSSGATWTWPTAMTELIALQRSLALTRGPSRSRTSPSAKPSRSDAPLITGAPRARRSRRLVKSAPRPPIPTLGPGGAR